MELSEAKEYIGKVCAICWKDRVGNENHVVSKVYDATYVPLYGGYLITDSDDIRLDRVVSVSLAAGATAASPAAETVAA